MAASALLSWLLMTDDITDFSEIPQNHNNKMFIFTTVFRVHG